MRGAGFRDAFRVCQNLYDFYSRLGLDFLVGQIPDELFCGVRVPVFYIESRKGCYRFPRHPIMPWRKLRRQNFQKLNQFADIAFCAPFKVGDLLAHGGCIGRIGSQRQVSFKPTDRTQFPAWYLRFGQGQIEINHGGLWSYLAGILQKTDRLQILLRFGRTNPLIERLLRHGW